MMQHQVLGRGSNIFESCYYQMRLRWKWWEWIDEQWNESIWEKFKWNLKWNIQVIM